MATTAWYRSLYWRIGVGLVTFLALVLALQALALVWLISRMDVAPGPPPPDVTRLVSRELNEALETNPALDIEQFLRQQYAGRVAVAAVMRDGRVLSSDGRDLAEDLVIELRARMDSGELPFLMGRGGRVPWDLPRGRGSR